MQATREESLDNSRVWKRKAAVDGKLFDKDLAPQKWGLRSGVQSDEDQPLRKEEVVKSRGGKKKGKLNWK